MNWLDRVESRTRPQRRKGFSMPPFWSTDGARVALLNMGLNPENESLGNGFVDYVQNAYKANGVVFACIAARCRVFSQARFAYQQFRKGRPAELYTDDNLRILEKPWRQGTTGEMLTHMDVDVAMGGNNYFTMCDEDGNIGPSRVRVDRSPFIARMRPDWTNLVIGAPSGNPWNIDARVIALSYRPPQSEEPLILNAGEFAHYSPIPDPVARFRGMSWLTPILRDVQADSTYTTHKISYLRNAATPNLAISVSEEVDDDEFDRFVLKFREEYEGSNNAYRTLLLAGGADVTPLSSNFQQLAIKEGQGSLETRIAAAAGVHPSIVGLSEGLQGAALNSGNFSAARRLAVDMTVRSLWGMSSASLEAIVGVRQGSRLWYDDRDIPFLREDAKDEAEIFYSKAQSLRQLTDGGWEPDAAVLAVDAMDIKLLRGKHTGLFSVQLQDPNKVPAQNNGQINDMPTLGVGGNGNGRQAAPAR